MNRKKITNYIIIVIVGMLAVTCAFYNRQTCLQQELAKKVLRFHVLANSDSKADQELKLAVRDAIGTYMQELVPKVRNKEECKLLITENLPQIERVAAEVVEKEGFLYEIHAELAECDFPVKTYGEYTFPAGKYEALRVTIGKGEGQNWWCVMYPNMCFENSMYEVVGEKSKKALRAVLDEKEYEAVLSSGKYQIKWKVLELFGK